MELEQLRHCAVVIQGTTEKLGVVDDALINPQTLSLAALTVTGAGLGRVLRLTEAQAMSIQDILTIDPDTVTVRAGTEPRPHGELKLPDYLLGHNDLKGATVMLNSGNLLGHLDDVCFDQETLRLTRLTVKIDQNAFPDLEALFYVAAATIPVTQEVSFGKDAIMVPDTCLQDILVQAKELERQAREREAQTPSPRWPGPFGGPLTPGWPGPGGGPPMP